MGNAVLFRFPHASQRLHATGHQADRGNTVSCRGTLSLEFRDTPILFGSGTDSALLCNREVLCDLRVESSAGSR